MSNDKANTEDKKNGPIPKAVPATLCTIDLPTFGRVHVTPYINVGTILDIENRFLSCEPTATQVVDSVFAGRARVETSDGGYRDVTREEVANLTDKDRAIFSRAFLDLIRSDENANVEDAESPVEALAAYVVAEWREHQESTKEISGMIKAGFSEKTINLFKESQSLADRVIATNKLPHFAEITKYQPAFEALRKTDSVLASINSPAIRAALRMRETPTWKAVMEVTNSPAARAARQLDHSRIAAEIGLGTSGKAAIEQALNHLAPSSEDNALQVRTLPPLKSAGQIMTEQMGKLREDLGDRMDRIGKAAIDIALQQDKTNSAIMSALVDMRTKWKEDERSSRRSLWLAAFSLLVSALITVVGVVQDHFNNNDSDRHQERVIKLLTQQTEAMEQQQQLVVRLAKANERLASQLEENAKSTAMRRTASR
jgi:hypothetical protein